jgi:preprotein translocase subunit SecD
MRVMIWLLAGLALCGIAAGQEKATPGQFEKDQAERLEAWRKSPAGKAALAEMTAAGSRLQLRLVLEKDAPGEFDAVDNPSGGKINISKEILLNEKAFALASLAKDGNDGRATVRVTLTEAGANQMEWVSSRNINQRLAIVFDGKLLMAPTIRSTIRKALVINGGSAGFNKGEADKLVAVIRGDK